MRSRRSENSARNTNNRKKQRRQVTNSTTTDALLETPSLPGESFDLILPISFRFTHTHSKRNILIDECQTKHSTHKSIRVKLFPSISHFVFFWRRLPHMGRARGA